MGRKILFLPADFGIKTPRICLKTSLGVSSIAPSTEKCCFCTIFSFANIINIFYLSKMVRHFLLSVEIKLTFFMFTFYCRMQLTESVCIGNKYLK